MAREERLPGRDADARKIARFIWDATPRAFRIIDSIPRSVEEIPQVGRDSIARTLRLTEPSAETWDLVVLRVEELVASEQYWRLGPAEPVEGVILA